jgi:dodecin
MASVVKVIEVLAESDKSWEDAAQTAVKKAAKTLKNIRSIYVQEMSATVQGDKIVTYRVDAKISFLLE